LEVHPILGQTYLPRKFKTTVVIPPQNDIDLHANDMNFVATEFARRAGVGFFVTVFDRQTAAHQQVKAHQLAVLICTPTT
jgi:sulfite reductase beta subunit-like hemoprotein